MEKTKAIAAAIRDDLKSSFNRIKRDLKQRCQTRVDAVVASAFEWALSKRPVQNAVVRVFACGTPLCKLLDDVVEDKVNESGERNIDADDVRGLRSLVENEVGEQIGDISDERWFTDVVRDAINIEDVACSVVDNEDFVKEVFNRVTSDDDMMQEAVKRALELINIELPFGIAPWGPFSPWPRIDQPTMN